MLLIKNEIEYLLKLLEAPPETKNDLFLRMHAWGILTMFNRVNYELEKISTDLESSLNIDALSLDFEKYWEQSNWNFLKFQNRLRKRQEAEQTQIEINHLADYLPKGFDKYKLAPEITPEALDSFKNAMHQLCDESKIGTVTIMQALVTGNEKMNRLLLEISNKVRNPSPHLYAKLWEDDVSKYEDTDYVEDYCNWWQNVGNPSVEELQAKRKQEIFKFQNKGFFRFCNMPTGAELKKRKLIITEDDLEYGTVIPEDFAKECARFEKFFEWKDGCIFVFNYEKLGKYIYMNYKKFDKDEEFFLISSFDKTMDLINKDIARLKPGLKKFLKNYEEEQMDELLNECKEIFKPFKAYLKEEYRKTLVDEYLEKLLFDSGIEYEVQSNLSGQSRIKYLVSIVKALSLCFIFKPGFGNKEFSEALSIHIDSVRKSTIKDYFKDKKTNNKKLNTWSTHTMDDLKTITHKREERG